MDSTSADFSSRSDNKSEELEEGELSNDDSDEEEGANLILRQQMTEKQRKKRSDEEYEFRRRDYKKESSKATFNKAADFDNIKTNNKRRHRRHHSPSPSPPSSSSTHYHHESKRESSRLFEENESVTEMLSTRREAIRLKRMPFKLQLQSQVAERKAKNERRRTSLLDEPPAPPLISANSSSAFLLQEIKFHRNNQAQQQQRSLSPSACLSILSSISERHNNQQQQQPANAPDSRFKRSLCESQSQKRSLSNQQSLQHVDICDLQLMQATLEKWVHMPFFDSVVPGCFVRVKTKDVKDALNNDGGGGDNEDDKWFTIEYCAEILEVLEGKDVYDLGATRTNKQLRIRNGPCEKMIYLSCVSNSQLTLHEFQCWYWLCMREQVSIPNKEKISLKKKAIADAHDYRVLDNKVLEAILQSKRRFQIPQPCNFALRKAELVKRLEAAKVVDNQEEIQQISMELQQLEEEADKVDRRRSATTTASRIGFINQRNRRLQQESIEEALRSEQAENDKLEANGGDPYKRLATRPCLFNKEIRNQLAMKRKLAIEDGSGNGQQDVMLTEKEQQQQPPLPKKVSSSSSSSVVFNKKESLQDIHNFEISLDLAFGSGDLMVDGTTTTTTTTKTSSSSSNAIPPTTITHPSNSSTSSSSLSSNSIAICNNNQSSSTTNSSSTISTIKTTTISSSSNNNDIISTNCTINNNSSSTVTNTIVRNNLLANTTEDVAGGGGGSAAGGPSEVIRSSRTLNLEDYKRRKGLL